MKLIKKFLMQTTGILPKIHTALLGGYPPFLFKDHIFVNILF